MDKIHPPVEGGELENGYSQGDTDETRRSFVTVNWDQTLYAVACKKYGKNVPLEAIFEVNHLTPTVKDGPNGKELQEPVYPGGKTYWLPARQEVDLLCDRYKQRVNDLVK